MKENSYTYCGKPSVKEISKIIMDAQKVLGKREQLVWDSAEFKICKAFEGLLHHLHNKYSTGDDSIEQTLQRIIETLMCYPLKGETGVEVNFSQLRLWRNAIVHPYNKAAQVNAGNTDKKRRKKAIYENIELLNNTINYLCEKGYLTR